MRILFVLFAGLVGAVALRAADVPGTSAPVINAPAANAPSTNAPGTNLPSTNVAPSSAALPTVDSPPEAPDVAVPVNQDPIKRFDGHMSLTSADFTVPDGWELRWESDQLLSIGVIRRDNTVVAGTTGKTVGSLYVPQGGSYRLRVTVSDRVPWDITIFPVKSAPPGDAYYVPSDGPVFKPLPVTPPVPVVVVAPKPALPVVAPVVKQLTQQQRQALVMIKGDREQGTGFFMKHGNDTVLVTTQQLLANNPNWQITTATGAVVQVTKIQGASDRDVAMLSVKDFGFAALPEGDPMKLKPGDTLLTASATEPVLPPVIVGALAQRRITINELRPVQGSPLVLASSGRVVGLIGVGPQVLPSNNFNDDNFSERDATSTGSVNAYGQRFDNVPTWDVCDASQLQIQTLFLGTFHQRTRALDAYLNGSGEYGGSKLWKADPKIKSANDSFVQDASGGNLAQRTQALQALLFEFGVDADTDMDQIQQPQNFYGYERLLAADELIYRKAIKNELDQFGSDTHRFDGVAQGNN